MMSSSQRWLARGAIAAVIVAGVVLLVFAGFRSVAMVVVAGTSVAVIAGTAYLFVAHRGAVRWAAAAVGITVLLAVPVIYIAAHLLWVAVVVVGLLLLAGAAGGLALTPADTPSMPARAVAPASRPFLVMNPRSGGGKVARFDLIQAAEALGAEVHQLVPGEDVQVLAEEAVQRGADLLGVAGGDGTQALVATVAAEHDLPFLVIPAGTRNHFALDLGLDREDPSTSLAGLTDGLEMRVDLGSVGGRTFVNNASFGAYAEIVQEPTYRDDKAGTALGLLPELLARQSGIGEVDIDASTLNHPQAVLVSNGPYAMNDLTGPGRRPSLDGGKLGVIAISVSSTRDAVGLLRRVHRRGLTVSSAEAVVVHADSPTLPVGVDGEALQLPTPVRCTLRPGALRVRVPRDRPGVPAPRPALDWAELLQLARPARAGGGRERDAGVKARR
ncbi:MAG TPA: diacylglycerol kinase family protein [Frankiaceae bacterium]|nr:diacylglycerol kinase family protein [Frankiaceae bacterium]